MTIAGNTNQLGVVNPSTTSQPGRPGAVSKGPGRNKPRIHLVSSKGKIPAGVYAEAIALKQKNKAVNPTVNTHPALASEPHSPGMKENPKGGNPKVALHQLKNPSGVAKRPAPKHQNNPALAGRFTPQGKAYANQRKAPDGIDVPTDDPRTEVLEKKRGVKT